MRKRKGNRVKEAIKLIKKGVEILEGRGIEEGREKPRYEVEKELPTRLETLTLLMQEVMNELSRDRAKYERFMFRARGYEQFDVDATQIVEILSRVIDTLDEAIDELRGLLTYRYGMRPSIMGA